MVCIGDQIFLDILGANRAGDRQYPWYILSGFLPRRRSANAGSWKKSYSGSIDITGLLSTDWETYIKKRYNKMFWNKNVLFCDINPTCYAISQQKEICKRHVKNLAGHVKFARERSGEKLPVTVSSYDSGLIKRGKGIDPVLQENKAVNIELACQKINGIVIHPGEEFSFWQTVGKATRKKGYKDGRVIIGNKLRPGTGGGLCNLANTIHLLILHSPLKVTEFHSHSDALAPDGAKRIPFSSGTSVNYNYIDYRFKNNTDQNIQLLVWCEMRGCTANSAARENFLSAIS